MKNYKSFNDNSELQSNSQFLDMGGPKAAAGTNTELYSKSKLVKIEGPNENV